MRPSSTHLTTIRFYRDRKDITKKRECAVYGTSLTHRPNPKNELALLKVHRRQKLRRKRANCVLLVEGTPSRL